MLLVGLDGRANLADGLWFWEPNTFSQGAAAAAAHRDKIKIKNGC
jgi:hypothetical protein